MTYVFNEKSDRVHSERVAKFLQEVSALCEKYGVRFEMRRECLTLVDREVSVDPDFDPDFDLHDACDETGTPIEQAERREALLARDRKGP